MLYSGERYLLDTNILLLLVRGGTKNAPLIAELEARFDLFTGRNRVFVSYVTVGEIRAIGERNNWGLDKWATLSNYLGSFQTVPIAGEEILNAYVGIENYSYYVSRDMGSKNDIWIAATADVYDLTLITTDKDFDHLSPEICTVEYLKQGGDQ